jgi:hypothetical protein
MLQSMPQKYDMDLTKSFSFPPELPRSPATKPAGTLCTTQKPSELALPSKASKQYLYTGEAP